MSWLSIGMIALGVVLLFVTFILLMNLIDMLMLPWRILFEAFGLKEDKPNWFWRIINKFRWVKQ